MVDTGFASSATLQLDGPASPAVALWRLVGALTQEQTRTLASEIELRSSRRSREAQGAARIPRYRRHKHESCAARDPS
jgi:xanthosine utilization system XapX-like protein